MKKHIRLLIMTLLMFGLTLALAVVVNAETQEEATVVSTNDVTEYCMATSELKDAGAKKRGDTGIDRTLLIVCDSEFDCSDLEGLTGGVFGPYGLCVLQFDTTENAMKAHDELQTWDQIQSVEFDEVVKLESETTGAETKADSHLSWGVKTIGADTYSNYVKELSPSELIVAVVDTGADFNHPFIASRLVAGWDFARNDSRADDEDGHGTHVAGTIVDCTADVSAIKVMPIKIFDGDGYGRTLDISNGILYAVDHGAKVINLSLGGPHRNTVIDAFLDKTVKTAIDQGVTVVVASGNDGVDIDRYSMCPAHIRSAITVGAINSKLKVAGFSNYGKSLDVVAPGVAIKSSVPGGQYETWDGTSMATPHVSACAALLKLRYPSLDCKGICSVLVRSCIPKTPVSKYGKGVINLNNLVGDIGTIKGQKIAPKTKSHVYTGAPIYATIVVSRNGKALFEGDDYRISSYQNNVEIGTASATVAGLGFYTGTKTVKFYIVPKGTSIRSIKGIKKGFNVKWNKQTEQTTGYQVRYATKKSMKGAKKVLVNGNLKQSLKKKKLSSGKKYYVQVRTYKSVNGTKYYSSWSKKKFVKTK